MNDSNLAGTVRSSANGALATVAIPQSDHIMYFGGGLYGRSRYIVKDFAENSYPVIQPDSTLQHRLKPGVTGTAIKDSQGTTLEFRDMYFSSNGKWAVADVPFRGMTRINIETGETIMFGRPFDYSIGLNPNFTSAISGNGRYALISEPKYNVLKIYDLANCQPTTDPVKKSCPEKDLLSLVKSQVPNYLEVWRAEFSTSYTIRVYIRKKDQNNQYYYDHQLWTAAGHQESGIEYLALGDSFASGEGAYNYKAGTDIEKPFNKCHLSTLSYPYLLARRAGLNSAESVACSGAKMKDIFTANENHYNHHLKQSEGKESDQFTDQIYRQFLVGYRTQASFVSKNKPEIVTLSISGNDIGFGKILFSCLMPGTCYKSEQERLDLTYTINSKFNNLVATYRQVKNDSASDAKIYVMGYPSLAAPDGDCALNVLLNREEIVFSNQIINHLNNTVQRAAAKTGVNYIDIEDAFVGKRLCEAPSSEVAVNGVTAGDDKTFSVPSKLIGKSLDFYLTGRESFHPNQIGHQLYADAIFKTTNGFTHHSSLFNPNTEAPALENPNNLVLHKIEFQNDLSNDFLPLNQAVSLHAINLQPGSQIAASVGLQPVTPTKTQADYNGSLSADFELPDGIKTGVHTLHLRAQNSFGEPIDIQKSVYITSDLTDIDGDGIPNNQERCLVVDESSVDDDRDGVDDACDGQISKPPVAPSSSTNRSINNSLSEPANDPGKKKASESTSVDHSLGADLLDEIRNPMLIPSSLQALQAAVSKTIKDKPYFLLQMLVVAGLLLLGILLARKKLLRR